MRGLGLAIDVVACVDAACRYDEGQAEQERRGEGGSRQARRWGRDRATGGGSGRTGQSCRCAVERWMPGWPVGWARIGICLIWFVKRPRARVAQRDVARGDVGRLYGRARVAMAWCVSRRRVGSLGEGKSFGMRRDEWASRYAQERGCQCLQAVYTHWQKWCSDGVRDF